MGARAVSNIIVPERMETARTKRGRAHLLEIMYRLDELKDKGKKPILVAVSQALVDDMLAFFDAAYLFDGQLPDAVRGVPITYVAGATRDIRVYLDGETENTATG